MTPTLRPFVRLTSTAPVAGNAEAVLQLSTPQGAGSRRFVLRGVKVKRASGVSATNIQPRVYSTSGAPADDLSEVWRAGASTAPGTLVNAAPLEHPAWADENGRLYLSIDGDPGDTFNFEVYFEVLL